jgi:hypothetical protein
MVSSYCNRCSNIALLSLLFTQGDLTLHYVPSPSSPITSKILANASSVNSQFKVWGLL